jgi:signal transduction histidine kinase
MQLQQASNVAHQRGATELVETLKHYLQVFTQLDAEYEKYFNDYEKMSKLQRLLEKDPNEVLREFEQLVERVLRVDYNIKSSFSAHIQHRLHSFQWNQRCS